MPFLSRRQGVVRPAAWAAALLLIAGCTGSTGGSATPTFGAPAVPPSAASNTSPAPTQTATGEGVALGVRDFTLEPLDLSIKGSEVVIDVSNAGPTIHNVTIRDATGKVLGATRDLREGESETLAASLSPGTYTLFCSLPGHESLGIKGTLNVTQR